MARQLQFYCNRCCRAVDDVFIRYGRNSCAIVDVEVHCHGKIETLRLDEQELHNMDLTQIGNAFAEEHPTDTPWFDPVPTAVEHDVIDSNTFDGQVRRHQIVRMRLYTEDVNPFLTYDHRRYRG